MIDIATATAVIGAASSAVALADQVFGSLRKFRDSGKVEEPKKATHRELIAASGDGKALVHSSNGHVARVVTREELAGLLTKSDAIAFEAVEKRMAILVKKWSRITEEYELVDANQRAIYDQRLDNIADDLGGCLTQTMAILENVGFQLGDHYGAMRMIAHSRG